MPSKKKKYNARFPAGRIKKIMQSDEEIGKVAQAVPVIIFLLYLNIPRTLELFVESLLTKTLKITNSRNAKTLSTSHMKQCIIAEQRFDFLRELVKNISDISVAEEAANYNEDEGRSSPEENYPDSDTPYDLSMPSTSVRASRRTLENGGNFCKKYTQNASELNTRSQQYEKNSRAHLKRESDVILRIQHRVGIPTGVLMDSTSKTSVNSDYLLQPPKLMRPDSTLTTTISSNWQSQKDRHQLLHQSQSVLLKRSIGTDNNCSVSCISSKQSINEHPLLHSQSAVPAPIVNFDFCNKPVVKIDYSNLSMPPNSSTAPANVATTNTTTSSFNFSAEPIISIDLSNVVTTAENSSQMGTITIGAIPPTSVTTLAPVHLIAVSKVSAAQPFTPSNPITNATATAAINNSFFELDEDYDNI